MEKLPEKPEKTCVNQLEPFGGDRLFRFAMRAVGQRHRGYRQPLLMPGRLHRGAFWRTEIFPAPVRDSQCLRSLAHVCARVLFFIDLSWA